MQPDQSKSTSSIQFGGDVSQQNVYSASQGVSISGNVSGTYTLGGEAKRIEIDQEVANLLKWLAEQQGISPELALKKAVVTAAYIYDLTASQGGKLLVQRKDNSVGEIVLK
jgi:hypothetical protein